MYKHDIRDLPNIMERFYLFIYLLYFVSYFLLLCLSCIYFLIFQTSIFIFLSCCNLVHALQELKVNVCFNTVAVKNDLWRILFYKGNALTVFKLG